MRETAVYHDREAEPPRGAFIFCSLDASAAERKLAAILSRLASPFDGERVRGAKVGAVRRWRNDA